MTETITNEPTTALVINPDGVTYVVNLAKADLASVQACIGGGYIEGVPHDGGHAYVDEEGKIKGLPHNPGATDLLLALGWEPYPLDSICGPAVFFGPWDGNGDETSVADSTIEAAKSLGILS